MKPLEHIRDRSHFRTLEVSKQVQILADHAKESAEESDEKLSELHDKLDKINRDLAHLRLVNTLSTFGMAILLVIISAGVIIACSL